MLLGEVLKETTQRLPEKVALWFGDRSWTYRDLDDQSEHMAANLRTAGVATGDRVALFMPNCPEMVLAYLGIFKLGAIAVPLNHRYRAPEVQYAVEHSGSRMLLVHAERYAEVQPLSMPQLGIERCYLAGTDRIPPGLHRFDELLTANTPAGPAPAIDEQAPLAILYTSGTTSRPKGVIYTHRSLIRGADIQARAQELVPDDVHLISMAICHAAGLATQLIVSILRGASCVLMAGPGPAELVHAIRSRRATRVQMLPADLENLVEYLETHPADLSSLRTCFSGGDIVPVEIHKRFQALTGLEVTEVYGMTECLSTIINPPFGRKKRGSIGKVVPDTQIRLLSERGEEVPVGEPGEIVVQSVANTPGYWNNPEATAATIRDGWLFTGDLARRDEDDYYWFLGRKKEIIIRGGSNISPLEVEEVIYEHPAIHLACVVGLPDRHYGQVVAAYLALRPELPAPTVDELRQFIADRIAAYKVPERIVILPELPLNATGKVDREKLHEMVVEKSPR